MRKNIIIELENKYNTYYVFNILDKIVIILLITVTWSEGKHENRRINRFYSDENY